MTPVSPGNTPVTTEVDGFGRRSTGLDAETGDEVELLDLAPQLVEHASFVTAVGERVEGVAQMILVRGAAAGGEQPSGSEACNQRTGDEDSDFQRLQCNLPICQARSKAVAWRACLPGLRDLSN